MAKLIEKTKPQEWLRKYADMVETVQTRVRTPGEYHSPYSLSPVDYNSYTYVDTTVSAYKITLSTDTLEYLCKMEDIVLGSRDTYSGGYSSAMNPYGESMAEHWIKNQMAEENKEAELRHKYPTLQAAWDEYQFLKTLYGEK